MRFGVFNIDDLMCPAIQERFDKLEHIESQTVFLLQLLDYASNFPDEEAEISKYCKEKCNEVYPMGELRDVIGEKRFILDYALRVRDICEVKTLINSLCSDKLDKMDNFDMIIDSKQNVFAPIQSIDDYEFTGGKKLAHTTKKTLNDIMKYKALVMQEKEKK